MLRAPASLQCRVGGASVPRSARLAVPLCWQCSKGSAAVSLPQWCPMALQCWRGGSPESPQCPVALQCPAALQCRTGSIPRVPCVPAVLDGQQSCIPAASCVPEVMAAAVPAVQAVPRVPAVLGAWQPSIPVASHGPPSLHGWQPCVPAVFSVPGWVSALYPFSVPCPCNARWVSAPHPCSGRWVSAPHPHRAGRSPRLVLPFLQCWQLHAVPACPCCAWQAVPLHWWHTMFLCLGGEKLSRSLAGSHRVVGSRLPAVHPVTVPRWV